MIRCNQRKKERENDKFDKKGDTYKKRVLNAMINIINLKF